MDVYQKTQLQKKKDSKIVCNLFRTAVATLKLGAERIHFEILLSLLNYCGSQIGNIGHILINFNDTLCSFEKSIKKHIKSG